MMTIEDAQRMTEKNKIDSVEMEIIRIENKIKEAIGKKKNTTSVTFDYDIHSSLIGKIKETGFFHDYWDSSGTYYLTLKW